MDLSALAKETCFWSPQESDLSDVHSLKQNKVLAVGKMWHLFACLPETWCETRSSFPPLLSSCFPPGVSSERFFPNLEGKNEFCSKTVTLTLKFQFYLFTHNEDYTFCPLYFTCGVIIATLNCDWPGKKYASVITLWQTKI